jgi:predicted metal-binding membrane protein
MVVLASLAAVTVFAWAYVWWLSLHSSEAMPMPANGPSMPGMDMPATLAPRFVAWSPAHFLFMFAMWAVMMIGMMTPSVAPMVLIYAQVGRQAATLGKPFAPAGWFAGGYLVAWSLFALVATGAQWLLDRLALLAPQTASLNTLFGGALLVAVGVYQWTPLKDACLSQCRAPLAFVQRHGGFKPGIGGSLRLGALHGLYCIGCCALLMTLLFVGGVMSLLWIAGLAIFVLVEKILPGGRIATRIAGLAAIAVGVWMLAAR